MQFLGLLPGASTLGSRVGGDIGGVLRGLAENKLNNMQNAQQVREKEQFLIQGGLAPNFARALSTQSDEAIQNVLKGLEGFGSAGPASQQYGQPMQSQPMANQQQAPMQQQQNQPMANQQQAPMQQQQSPVDINALVKQAYEQFPELKGQFKPAELNRILKEQVKQQQASEQPQQNQQQGVLPAQPRVKTKAEAAQERELAKEDYKFDLKEKAEAKKESINYLKELNKDFKDTRESNMRLDKMENLINSGRLSTPLFSSALATLAKGIFGIGIDHKFILTPENQEFDKLSTDFLRGAKNIFGSRVTQSEINLFLNTIPNVKQSNEAKMAVIDNMRIFNDGKIALEKTAKEIIKENNGIVPGDLEALVTERAAPELDALAQDFKKIKKRNVAPALGRASKLS